MLRRVGWGFTSPRAMSLDLLKEAATSLCSIGRRTISRSDADAFRANSIDPYSVELNDSPSMVFRQESAMSFERMIVDQSDEMLYQSKKYPLVFTLLPILHYRTPL